MSTENNNPDSHFPEDPSSVNISVKRSFIKDFYYRNKRETDLVLYLILLLLTILTVSFSVYIVIVKYF